MASQMTSQLIAPHGGSLAELLADPDRVTELKTLSRQYASWDLTHRQLCDLELLLNGGFSPLRGFMTRADYESVSRDMRLTDGTLWPIPIVLDVSEETARTLDPGSLLALRDPEGVMLATLHVEDVWKPDITAECERVYGTTNTEHPGPAYFNRNGHPWYVGGKVEGVQLPHHYDFAELRLTPGELRERFASMGWNRTVAFQTRNPMHRAHQELTLRAVSELDAALLIHPVVGSTKPGDVDH
ncbi:MAG: adenylyltransferase, partial [Planctomycetota bacterium]